MNHLDVGLPHSFPSFCHTATTTSHEKDILCLKTRWARYNPQRKSFQDIFLVDPKSPYIYDFVSIYNTETKKQSLFILKKPSEVGIEIEKTLRILMISKGPGFDSHFGIFFLETMPYFFLFYAKKVSRLFLYIRAKKNHSTLVMGILFFKSRSLRVFNSFHC